MDPVTHGALGAACAQALLYKHDKHNAWLVGGLAAMAPDLDIFINSSTNPMLLFLYHRHFTHSLSFIPIGSLLVALGLLLFKRFRHNWGFTLLAAFIGYATHGLIDACTSYGTMLLWPFSNSRISWDVIAIVDPFFTIPLILGVAWTLIHDDRLGVIIGLALAGLFLLFNTFQHYRAISTAQAYGESQHWKVARLRAFPDLASSTIWRVAAEVDSYLRITDVYTPLTKKSEVQPIANLSLFRPAELPDYIKESGSQLRDFAIFNWFCNGYLILVQQKPLILADGRFLMGKNPTISLWGIQFLPDHPHVNRLSFIQLESIK